MNRKKEQSYTLNQSAVLYIKPKMIIELDENESEKILKEVVKVCKKVEPDCEIEGL